VCVNCASTDLWGVWVGDHPDLPGVLNGFPEWEQLGRTEVERRRRWRVKVRAAQAESELTAVRRSLQSGRPLGSPEWMERMAERLKIELNPRPRGRPRKVAAEVQRDADT
jgi:hypothetical protein